MICGIINCTHVHHNLAFLLENMIKVKEYTLAYNVTIKCQYLEKFGVASPDNEGIR